MTEQYELVLQFALAPRDVARFDRITDFETRLEHRREHSEGDEPFALDGSDCMLGCISVRLMTNDPPRALEAVRGMIPPSCPYDAGFRTAHTDEALTAL